MNKKFIFIYLFIIIISLFRFFNLLNQPPFLDETIYAVHIKNIGHNFSLANILAPARVGLSPLFIYISSITYFVIKNSILAGRITSLLIYLTSIPLLYLYLKKIHAPNPRLAIFFFAFNPFIFLYSQMTMLETTLIFSGILFLIATENLVKKTTNINIVLTALTFTVLLFSKYIGIFLLPYLILRLIHAKKYREIFLFLLFFLIIALLTFTALFPFTKRVLELSKIHSSEKAANIFKQMILNLRLEIIWLKDYFQIPILIIGGIIFAINVLKKNKYILSLVICFIINFLYFMLFARGFFPRYLILSALVLTVILAFTGNNRSLSMITLIVIFSLYATNDWFIYSDLEKAKIAKEDVWQYATDWTSGKNIIGNFKLMKDGEKFCVPEFHFPQFEIARESYFPSKNLFIEKLGPHDKCNFDKTLTPMARPEDSIK